MFTNFRNKVFKNSVCHSKVNSEIIAGLLCAGSSVAQDLWTANMDIIAELQKLKHMDERIQKLEETLTKVMSENEGKVSLY